MSSEAVGSTRKARDDAVNAVNKDDKTALDRALNYNRAEFAAVLRDELGGKRAADL